ncbi:MAG: type II secretion system F family protein [Lachnospiraceae bacterium]|nr:type II secretion system F family protein [Lachnospiraceae bacterium]
MNYDKYRFSGGERIMYLSAGAVLAGLVSWTFYRSSIAFLILIIPLEYVFLRYMKRSLIEKRKYELSLGFREAIMAVQSSLNAGYSVENAFIEAGRVMEKMYGDSPIRNEFRILTRRLRSNETLEKILLELSYRSGIEDIEDFANVFAAAKRSGGDFTRIIRKAAESIGDKMDVRRDIRTAISSKRYENRVMEAVPFGIIIYLNITSAGFLSALYHNITGCVIMTVCLSLYIAGFIMAEKIISEAEKV